MSKPFYTIDEFIIFLDSKGIQLSASEVIDCCIEENLFLSVPIDFNYFYEHGKVEIYSSTRTYKSKVVDGCIQKEFSDQQLFEFYYFYEDLKSEIVSLPLPRLEKNNFGIDYYAFVPCLDLFPCNFKKAKKYYTFTNSLSLKPIPLEGREEGDKEFLYFLRAHPDKLINSVNLHLEVTH